MWKCREMYWQGWNLQRFFWDSRIVRYSPKDVENDESFLIPSICFLSIFGDAVRLQNCLWKETGIFPLVSLQPQVQLRCLFLHQVVILVPLCDHCKMMGEFHLHNTEKDARKQKWPSILLQPKNCSKRNFRRKSPTKTSCRTANSEVPGHWRSALLQRVQSPNLPVQISALFLMSQLRRLTFLGNFFKKISTSKCRFTICSSKCSGGKVPPRVPPQYLKFFDLRVDGPWPIQNNLLDKTYKTYKTYMFFK